MLESKNSVPLVTPKIAPLLDPAFRPAALVHRALRQQIEQQGGGVPVRIALEQADGNVSRYEMALPPNGDPVSPTNFFYVERTLKLLLWSGGGFRIHFDGPEAL